jgi:hypothetical protein
MLPRFTDEQNNALTVADGTDRVNEMYVIGDKFRWKLHPLHGWKRLIW